MTMTMNKALDLAVKGFALTEVGELRSINLEDFRGQFRGEMDSVSFAIDYVPAEGAAYETLYVVLSKDWDYISISVQDHVISLPISVVRTVRL